MKKAIFLPVLGVLAITLWSFTPAPQAQQIITDENGIAYIPSTVNMTPEDQNILLQAFMQNPNSCFYVYNAPDGSLQQIGTMFGSPVDPEALRQVDQNNPGMNAEAMVASSESTILNTKQWKDINDKTTYKSTSNLALWQQIGPVLVRYGYVERAN